MRAVFHLVFAFSLGVGCATAPAANSPPTTPVTEQKAPTAPVADSQPTTPATPQKVPSAPWPPLPNAFLSGRPATPADVGEGRAVFAAQASGMPPAEAIAIPLPQYAYCAPGGGESFPGIIVQAERAGGIEFVGFRTLAGKSYVTLLMRCRLLGQQPPLE